MLGSITKPTQSQILSKYLIVFVMLLITTGCSSTPNVNYDKNAKFDFSLLKTYRVLTKSDKPGKFTTLNGKRIASAITTRLNQSGFNQVEKPQADFLVAYHSVIEKNFKVTKAYRNYGYSPYWRSYTSEPAYIRSYKKGTLIIDIIDPKLKEVVWRGSVSTKIKANSSIEKKIASITTAVNLILNDFPN